MCGREPEAARRGPRNRGQQLPCVRMLRLAQHLARRPCSTTRPARITSTRSASSATTARSWLIKQQRVACIAACAQQRKDLPLHGHVECRSRFVSDQERCAAGDRGSDQDALPQATGQLMRILRQPVFRIVDTDRAQQLGAALANLVRRYTALRFGDQISDPPERIERDQRVLQHVADLAAADGAPVALAIAARVLAGDLEPLGMPFGVRTVQARRGCAR